MKMYKINRFTWEEWNDIETPEYPDNVITVVESDTAVDMDIEADGQRIVPILRKLAATAHAAGYQNSASFFDEWLDVLTDPSARRDMLWNYSGAEDRKNGCWSYSWGIEQHEGSWYVFLNIAKGGKAQC